MDEDIVLTRDEAIRLQDRLIEEYSKQEFQKQLHKAWKGAKTDVDKANVKKTLCEPIQLPIIVKFGFEASKKGVILSVRAYHTQELMADAEVKARNEKMAALINPDLQENPLDEDDQASEGVITTVTVDINGLDEEVQVDSMRGPLLLLPDGKTCAMMWKDTFSPPGGYLPETKKTKDWLSRSKTEQNILINFAAKRNRGLKMRLIVS